MKNKRIRTLGKNNKLYNLGTEGQRLIRRMRAEGRTLQEITNYLNENYKNTLKPSEEFKILNLSWYFRRHGDTIIQEAKNKEAESLSKILNTSDKLEKLINLLDKWLDEYRDSGEKLKLRDTINAYIKLLELNMKKEEGLKDNQKSNELQSFMMRLKDEFSTPSITKEIEFDKDGNPTKAKITQKLRGEKEELKEELEEVKEEIKEELETKESLVEEVLNG